MGVADFWYRTVDGTYIQRNLRESSLFHLRRASVLVAVPFAGYDCWGDVPLRAVRVGG